MRNLKRANLIDPILKAILQDKKPFLGICLGMQVLFDECEEFGPHKGLGILPGKVIRFRLPKKYKIPHMGWNRLKKQHRLPILANITDGMYVYFVHSYYVVPASDELVMTTTDYGKEFCSSVGRENIFACQFHPEKSQQVGLEIIRAFAQLPFPLSS
jgi:glutamine amidotransferase